MSRSLRDQVVDIGQRQLGKECVNRMYFAKLVDMLSAHMFKTAHNSGWEVNAVREAARILEEHGTLGMDHPGVPEAERVWVVHILVGTQWCQLAARGVGTAEVSGLVFTNPAAAQAMADAWPKSAQVIEVEMVRDECAVDTR